MTDTKKTQNQTELILKFMPVWRILFALAALVGIFGLWAQDLSTALKILFSALLGLAGLASLVAIPYLLRRDHKARMISLVLDYLGLLFCVVGILQVGQVFIGIDSLGAVFQRGVPFLGVVLVGYLVGAASDWFPHQLERGKTLQTTGKIIMAAGFAAFLLAVNVFTGLWNFITRLMQPAGLGLLLGAILLGLALWVMWRAGSAQAFNAKTSDEQMISGWLFLSPNLLGFLIFFAGPLLLSFYFSFTDSDAFNPPNWVGLENYAKILNITVKPLSDFAQPAREALDIKIYDEVGRLKIGNGGILFGAEDKFFWLALRNTLTFALLAVPMSVIPALFLSNLLNMKLPGMKFFRAVYFMPSIAAIVGISLVWQWLYNATIGYINYFITLGVDFLNSGFAMGLIDPKIQWTSNSDTALLSIVIMAAWQTMGFNTVLFLAGLQNIPGELYEAATVDGAGPWDKFWSVTLPMLAPTTFFIVTTTTIQAMQVFEQIFILMNPPEGPGNSTISLVLYLYRSGFQNFKQGYASAIAWVLFIVIFGLTLLQFQRQRKSSIYEG
jgi:ABC-type sugar transport system permease subunit